MKKLLLVITSIITQLLIWALAFFAFFWFIEDIIKNLLGDILYNTYGKAVRPYMLLYFVLIFIIAEVAALLSNKIIKMKNHIFLYVFFTLAVNVIILGLIIENVIFKYGIMV